MNAARLAVFVALLAAVLAGGTALGAAVDPDARGNDKRGHDDVRTRQTATTDEPRGLATADGGLRVVAVQTQLDPGRTQPFRFRIVDGRDSPVTDFEVSRRTTMTCIARGARHPLRGRVSVRRPLPALPPVQARRARAHRRVHPR